MANNLPPEASAYVSRLLADAERDMLLDQAPVLFGEDDAILALWRMNDALLARVQTEERRRRRAERNALRFVGRAGGGRDRGDLGVVEMNVQPLNVTKDQARVALREYKQHRNVYDKRDWEIERIYRQIAKGKTVISVHDAIQRAGFDDNNRPHLAISRADDQECFCSVSTDEVIYSQTRWHSRRATRIVWPGAKSGRWDLIAKVPRIPPQYRPSLADLPKYHILWEADWKEIPRDPYLLRRIGKDAWVVLAAWDLTDVEMAVLRAHEVKQ